MSHLGSGGGGGGGGGGLLAAFGARMNAAAQQGNFFAVNGEPSTNSVAGAVTDSEFVVPKTGVILAVSWQSDSGDATTVFKLYVNGVVERTQNLTALVGSIFPLDDPLLVNTGDRIAIEYDAGTPPGDMGIWALIA